MHKDRIHGILGRGREVREPLLEESFQLDAVCMAVLADVVDVADVADVSDVEIVEIVDEVGVLTAVSLFVSLAVNFCVFQGQVTVEHFMAQVKHPSSHADLAVQAIDWP